MPPPLELRADPGRRRQTGLFPQNRRGGWRAFILRARGESHDTTAIALMFKITALCATKGLIFLVPALIAMAEKFEYSLHWTRVRILSG